jgi:hypothetical protein
MAYIKFSKEVNTMSGNKKIVTTAVQKDCTLTKAKIALLLAVKDIDDETLFHLVKFLEDMKLTANYRNIAPTNILPL